MFFDPKNLRHATTDDMHKILAAAPKQHWVPPKQTLAGITFELHSRFELDRLYEAFPTEFRDVREAMPAQLKRRTRVRCAGSFARTDEWAAPGGGGATYALECPELGAVYVDTADQSYLHFSPTQLPVAGIVTTGQRLAPKWSTNVGKDTATLSMRDGGSTALDVMIEYSDERVPPELTARLLTSCLPGAGDLVTLGLPLDQLVAGGAPKAIDTWLVDNKGLRVARLARHEISKIEHGLIESGDFSIPADYRDLRASRAHSHETVERSWHPVGGARRGSRRVIRPSRKSKMPAATKAPSAEQAASAYNASVGIAPKTKVSFDPPLPQCLPATLRTSAAFEIRQGLLDAVQFLSNLITNQMDRVKTTRLNPSDPDAFDIQLEIDWLDQLERSGDGLFCLLRDPPPADDPLGGGTGVLDRAARSLAAQLVGDADGLPIGGDDAPIVLPQAVAQEITAVITDAAIASDQRWSQLSAVARVALREAVLRQRIATILVPFHSKLGGMVWPSDTFDLVHLHLQLQRLQLGFSGRDTIRNLEIALDNGDANRPRIAFDLALRQFEARLRMQRSPGGMFWVTAGGTLVAAAIIGPLAVGPLVAALIGMGPFGIMALAGLLSSSAVAGGAGGALLLAAVTYLVWDVSELRLELQQPVLRSTLGPDRSSDPEEVVLEPDRIELEGNIVVSVNSQIPSGIHQLFDAITNFAIAAFDARVREQFESTVADSVKGAVRKLPHFCLPPRFAESVLLDVAAGSTGQLSVDAPSHELVGLFTTGIEERSLSATVVSRMNFPYAGLCPQATQVDPDLRERLTPWMIAADEAGLRPRFGYALSQNLLNGILFAQWLDGRFQRDYDNTQVEAAFATLEDACPECASVEAAREVHVWAAAAPEVYVTPRTYLEHAAKPYLAVRFADVRMCIGGLATKTSGLELQFAFESVAHVGLGGKNDEAFTLFTFERDFLHVLFDDRSEFLRLLPAAQGIALKGPGFDQIAQLSDQRRLEVLESLTPLFRLAAQRLLRRNPLTRLRFRSGPLRMDQQIYDDDIWRADIQPWRASLYVSISLSGGLRLVVPWRDAGGQFRDPDARIEGLTCEEAGACDRFWETAIAERLGSLERADRRSGHSLLTVSLPPLFSAGEPVA